MTQNRLIVVWLSGEKRAAADMALLYLRESLFAGAWKNAELWLWGPPVELAARDADVLDELLLAQSVGVRLSACMDCAVRYGVADTLAREGISVRGLSAALTEALQQRLPLLLI